MAKIVVTTFLAFFVFQSCQKSADKSNSLPLIEDAQNIVSTRAISEDQFFVLLKLPTAPLLATSKKVNGVTVINPSQKTKILSEQQQLIKDLKALSSDIQIVYRYKYVVNGLAIVGPSHVFEKVSTLALVASAEKVTSFARAEEEDELINPAKFKDDLIKFNSAKFIGAQKLNAAGITGRGVKVGVLDTGIDYTHAMFGGPGTPEAFKSTDPNKKSPLFPSKKVVGGIDLVGTAYDSSSLNFAFSVPRPDMNPLDEARHGSHVAGTIAGIGDKVTSYNGMAPDASLYAIKVFGAKGSTSDMVVIAGFEFAIDPNGDGNLADQLDVLNLSLGSSFGSAKIMYAEAVRNLVVGGTSAVISAGNAGDVTYIVGSPGTSTEALSVAATLDDTEHNWKFDTALITAGSEDILVELFEGVTTLPAVESNVKGDLVYIGLADKDLTPDQVSAVNGHVALIDRGGNSFNEKIKRAADAGAIGVVIANNVDAELNGMSTTDKFKIPAIMIRLDVGNKLKAALTAGAAAKVAFNSGKILEKPEKIDTIASFSSRGPRSFDGYLKPEISAPGQEIISTAAASGKSHMMMSGTSMAAPHMTGIMALMVQNSKDKGLNLTPLELKNVAMGTAKILVEKGVAYPVARQGAGRIQAFEATQASLVANVPSFAFGETNMDQKIQLKQSVSFKGLANKSVNYGFSFEGSSSVKVTASRDLSLSKGKIQSVDFTFDIDTTTDKPESRVEIDGWVKVINKADQSVAYRIPMLIVAHKNSNIVIQKAAVEPSGKTTLDIANIGANEGDAFLFNLLAVDERKKSPKNAGDSMSKDCDLQSVGYRIIKMQMPPEEPKAPGEPIPPPEIKTLVQFAIKTYKPMSTWSRCDVSVLFDANKDGVFEQELVGTGTSAVTSKVPAQYGSILLDSIKAKQTRMEFEAEVAKVKNDPVALAKLEETEDYALSILDIDGFIMYGNSSLVVVQADVNLLSKDAKGNLVFKVLTSHNDSSPVEFDDYLFQKSGQNFEVSSVLEDQPFFGFQMGETLPPMKGVQTVLAKGRGTGDLIGYFPLNAMSLSDTKDDMQSQIIKFTK